MSTSASLPHSVSAEEHDLPTASLESPLTWKVELNARLREHRQRRVPASPATVAAGLQGHRRASEKGISASKVAARVAERYSHAPSYRELLEASAAAEAAFVKTAAAALAAYTAAQVASSIRESHQAEVQVKSQGNCVRKDMFAEPFFTGSCVEQQQDSQEELRNEVAVSCAERAISVPGAISGTVTEAPRPASVEHHMPLPVRASLPVRKPAAEPHSLVDAFAEAVVPPAQSLPAKLIEFPRELIAPRKQRPRLAEGPLLAQPSPGVALRIFEVEAQVSGEGMQREAEAHAPDNQETDTMVFKGHASARAPEADGERARHGHEVMVRQAEGEHEEDGMPSHHAGLGMGAGLGHGREPVSFDSPAQVGQFGQQELPVPQGNGWSSIRLGEHPLTEAAQPAPLTSRQPEHGYKAEAAPALHDLASISDRLMAALVDGGIVFGCFLLSVLVFASCTVHPPVGKAAFAAGLLLFGVLATFYGWLFMAFSGGSTPGMRYARIALCTFADENPTRKDLQRRIPATALALLPLGLGVFWALLDEDKLGWHDRMTRTYQRSYR